MKSALIVLPACLLALAHLISAQITGVPPIDCEQVRNLSPECQAAFSRGAAGADAAAAFCSGDCFRTVLSAYQSCGSAGDAIVQGLQQGKKKHPCMQLATTVHGLFPCTAYYWGVFSYKMCQLSEIVCQRRVV